MIFRKKKKKTKISRAEFDEYAENMISAFLLGRFSFEFDPDKINKSEIFIPSDLSDGLEFLSLGLRKTDYSIDIDEQAERDFFQKIDQFLLADGKGSRWLFWCIPFIDEAAYEDCPDLSLQFILDEFWKIIPDENKL